MVFYSTHVRRLLDEKHTEDVDNLNVDINDVIAVLNTDNDDHEDTTDTKVEYTTDTKVADEVVVVSYSPAKRFKCKWCSNTYAKDGWRAQACAV